MTKSARNFILIMVAIFVSAFGLKIFWDGYQMDRAMEQNPKVIAMIDQIRPFSGSSRIPSEYEGPSTNEYASAVWRYYFAEAKCSEVQTHLDAEALRNGFKFDYFGHQNSGTQVYHRQGEYEMRELFEPQTNDVCNYALSVNWYGLDR